MLLNLKSGIFMKRFEITLKNEKVNRYKTSFIIIVFLNLIGFLFLTYVSPDNESRNTCFLAAILVGANILLHFLIKNKNGVDFYVGAVGISILFYFRLHYYWLAISVILLAILYFIAIRKLSILFTEKKILYPSIPVKQINWIEVNNVILKDGLLTVDFKNDKLVQQYIDETTIAVNEAEFNDFCRQQLSTTPS
jgi:hypothetical protein